MPSSFAMSAVMPSTATRCAATAMRWVSTCRHSDTMPRLHQSPNQPAAPAVQPGLPVLRCADHPAPRHAADQHQRDCHTQAHQSGRLGGAWAQRGPDPRTGQGRVVHWPIGYWPGIHFGVRGPTQDETPLSWEEVQHGLAQHVIGGV